MTLLMTACSTQVSGRDMEAVSPTEFQALLKEDPDAYLLDVRRPDEYANGHLEGAHLLDWLDSATFRKEAIGLDKHKTIYVYCRSGRRSNEAANYLAGKGYKVVDMDGGILAWENAGLPVTNDTPVSKHADDSDNGDDRKTR